MRDVGTSPKGCAWVVDDQIWLRAGPLAGRDGMLPTWDWDSESLLARGLVQGACSRRCSSGVHSANRSTKPSKSAKSGEPTDALALFPTRSQNRHKRRAIRLEAAHERSAIQRPKLQHELAQDHGH